MQPALEIIDTTPTGKVLRRASIELASERVTIREIIERRVRQEVAAFNAKRKEMVFSGLIQPTDTEADLNGYRLRKRRELDADEQCRQAIKAFKSNGFFVFVDDRQVESLDEEVPVTRDTTVSFVKLVPLVGG